MKLSLQKIALLAEIIGAIAVVCSLLYLGQQIRIQNEESRAAARHDFYVGWRESTVLFTDTVLADIFVRASEDPESLSEAERLQLLGGLHGLVRLFEEAFLQHQEERIDQDLWNAVNRQYSSLFSSPVYKKYWEERGQWYHKEFQKHVNKLQKLAYKI
ncbi:MAG: hypothetical protein ACI915_003417 [Gammaproteobacteria bacterium]